MFSTSSALSRRMFLCTAAGAAGAAALSLRAETAPTACAALAFDGDALLVAGADLIRTDDGRRSWSSLQAPGVITSLATHPARPGRVLAGLDRGVALSNDGGRTWEARAEGLPETEVLAVAMATRTSDTFYVALRGDGLWKSEDAGLTWSFAIDRPWVAEAERDLLTLASVDLETGMGGIWIYGGTDAGVTRIPDCFCRWQDVQSGNALDALVSDDAPPPEAPLPEGQPVSSLASAPSAPAVLHAALPSAVWSSQDGGVVWARVAAGVASAVAVHPKKENRIAAIIDGALKASRDGGASWTAIAAA